MLSLHTVDLIKLHCSLLPLWVHHPRFQQLCRQASSHVRRWGPATTDPILHVTRVSGGYHVATLRVRAGREAVTLFFVRDTDLSPESLGRTAFPDDTTTPCKVEVNCIFAVQLSDRYVPETDRVIVLDTSLALTVLAVSSIVPPNRLHVPNPDVDVAGQTRPFMRQRATYHRATVFELLRDTPAPVDSAHVFLDYCGIFGDRVRADIELLMGTRQLKRNGVFAITVCTRTRKRDDVEQDVTAFLVDCGARYGYVFDVRHVQAYGTVLFLMATTAASGTAVEDDWFAAADDGAERCVYNETGSAPDTRKRPAEIDGDDVIDLSRGRRRRLNRTEPNLVVHLGDGACDPIPFTFLPEKAAVARRYQSLRVDGIVQLEPGRRPDAAHDIYGVSMSTPNYIYKLYPDHPDDTNIGGVELTLLKSNTIYFI